MSTIEVEILGQGSFAGAIANITDYSVQEYGASLSMAELNGGVTSISFGALEEPGFNGSILLPGQPFELRDPWAGVQRGIIDSGTSSNGYTLSVQGSGALLPLVSQRAMGPYSGTLGGAITTYFASCGITSGFQFDPIVAAKPVDLPYWEGDVWTQIKKLMAIHQFEVADVAGRIIVRRPRLRSVDVERYESVNLSYGRGQASQTVEVYYYNNEYKANHQIYPLADVPSPDRPIISVGASEESVTNYPVDMWVETIDAPSHVLSLPPDHTTATSVYSVVDKDGIPVTTQEWRNGGGSVSFAVGPDGKSVDVTVLGMSTQSRAPYRIAGSSQDREYQYAALYIVANGITFDEQMVWSPSGASLVDAPADSVSRIQDPMVSSRADALTVLANAVRLESGFVQTLDVSARAINRRGETGVEIGPTFGEFDAVHAGWTFSAFNSANAGKTFRQYNNEQVAEYSRDFENQAMGSIGGARVRHLDNMYRIREGTTKPAEFSWVADPDLLFSDWQALSPDAGATFGAFNAKWTGKTFEQHARQPLA